MMKMYSILLLIVAGLVMFACGGSGGDKVTEFVSDVANDVADSNVWEDMAPSASPPARECHSAISLVNSMYVFGGTSDTTTAMDDLWEYTPSNNSWTLLAPSGNTPPGRYCHSAVVIDQQMIVFGGTNGTNAMNDIWVCDLSYGDGTWEQKNPSDPPAARFGHSAALLVTGSSDKMYVFGGFDGTTYMNDLWVYDLYDGEGGTWTKVNPSGTAPQERYRHTAVTIGNKMYVFGGYNPSTGALGGSVWVYDPADGAEGSWAAKQPGGDSVYTRYNHVAAVRDDRMFVFGGMAGLSGFRDLHVYDPAEGDHGTWDYLDPDDGPNAWHSCSAVFIGGKLYVFGSRDSSNLWRYSPAKY